jgi:CRISPR-associated endonuclease Cas2
VPGSVFAATTGVDVETCEDYGVRVQFSLFECWLEDDAYQALWEKLQSLIDAKEDRLVAYSLDAAAVRKRAMAGETMRCTEKVQWYVV